MNEINQTNSIRYFLSPFDLSKEVVQVTQKQTCFENYICINQDIVSVYSVFFTIVLGILFYIYGVKNNAHKVVLTEKTEIHPILIFSILSFGFSFINLNSVLYALVNFSLLVLLFSKLYRAIVLLKQFNKNTLSAELIVKEHKIDAVKKRLREKLLIERQNIEFTKIVDKLQNVDNWLSSDDLRSYDKTYLAEKDCYIAGIDIDYLKKISSEYVNNEAGLNQESNLTKKGVSSVSFYIPFNVSIGKKIKAGQTLFCIKGFNYIDKKDFSLDKLIQRTSVQEYFSEEYLDEELKSSFEKVLVYIEKSNYKFIELELEKVAEYFDLVFGENRENYSEQLVSTVANNFLTPLIVASFEKKDIKVINEINSFVIRYLYKSIDQKSLDKLEIFINQLKNELWCYSRLEEGETKRLYIQNLAHSLHSLVEYSLRSNLEKTKGREDYTFYNEAIKSILVFINSVLKQSYQKKDLNTFKRAINITNSILEKKYYSDDGIDDLRNYKYAIIFGLASCIFRDYRSTNNEITKNEISDYLNVIEKNVPNKLDNMIQIADLAIDIADRSKLDWDNLSWDDTDDILGVRSGMISTHIDIQYFLTKLLAKGFKNQLLLNSETSFSSEKFISPLDEAQQKQILREIVDDEGDIESIYNKVSSVYQNIRKNYDNKVKDGVIAQKLNISKIEELSRKIFEGYRERALIRSISKKIEIQNNNNAKGYNFFFFKERFIDDTNFYFSEDDDKKFGKDIARSENNQLLTDIYTDKITKTKENNNLVNERDLVKIISKYSENYPFAVIWSKNYIHLDDYHNNNPDFKPVWQLSLEEKSNPKGNLLGKVKNTEVYFAEVFPEVEENYAPSLFFFKKDDVTINEFIPTNEADKSGVYEFIDNDQKLLFSISDPSEMSSETIEKILKNNIDMDINDLKSRVILKLYKGSELSRGDTKLDNILHYLIE